MEPSDLARDTAVSRLKVAPGWYTAELSNASMLLRRAPEPLPFTE